MRFLRTVPTRRLLAMVAGLVIAAAGGTAIAVAAVGSGPVPHRERLAVAVHRALAAPATRALSADIAFTNNLIPSGQIGGSDPLLSSATGRLWIDRGHLRLELQGSGGDAQVVVGPHRFFVYDPAADTVYEGDLGAGPSRAGHHRSGASGDALPSIARIQSVLHRLSAHLGISGAQPTDVAGRPAYRVAVSPRAHGGLLGRVALAWDALRGVPLDFAVYARGNSTPVLELKATGLSYGPVARSVFALTPPAGAKVVKLSMPSRGGSLSPGRRQTRPAHLGFAPVAPAALAGRAREAVKVIGWGGHAAELVTYGKGLDAIVVLEHASAAPGSGASRSSSGGGSDGQGLSLPTVNLGGVTAQQLPTALGTIVSFTRGGIGFIVAGSVAPSVADAAARALS